MKRFPIACLAAKTDPEHAGYWLPLWMHSRDTAEVARRLAMNWLSDAARCAFDMDEERLAATAYFLGAVHDMGKATLLFQDTITRRLPQARERLFRACAAAEPFAYPAASPHARAGEAILLAFDCPGGLASVVGAHHGKPQEDTNQELIRENISLHCQNYYGREDESLWRAFWKDILDEALRGAGFASVADLPALNIPQELLLTGLLIMADWIASNPRFFPLLPEDDLGGGGQYPRRVSEGWAKVHLPAPWQTVSPLPMDGGAFLERFGFAANAVQQAVLETAAAMEEPGLLILEAQMGVGKTEAALAAAETFAARWGAGGLFFGLPTQATANGIFDRLSAWARTQSEDTAHAIRLAHGMAELNEAYQSLLPGRAFTQEDAQPEEGVYVHPWFQGHKQALLADFVIGTVDQLLMAALRQRHLMLRHLGLAGKVVVIDEVHAYDAYMNTYLDRALAWLGQYRVPVILLSATLPARRRSELTAAYAGDSPSSPDHAGYPLLTWTQGSSVRQRAVELPPEQRQIHIETAAEEALPHLLRQALAEGGCAGVIVNTVKKAQALAALLRAALPECHVVLFHAQFLMPDRAEKERFLLERLGKGSTAAQRDRLVVVGTQVLEQSLDIDFDFLATELCPMDLLLQRIGREHRHAGRARPAPLKRARCAVLIPEEGFDEGSRAVYGEWLLRRTKMLLPAVIRLPGDIPALVQDAYRWDEDDALPGTEESARALQAYRSARQDMQARAQTHVIARPKISRYPRRNVLDNWMHEESAHFEAQARAAVRDGEPSVEVLVMMRRRDGTVCFLPWQERGASVPTDRPPSQQESRRIARQRLRLPGYFSRRWTIDAVIRELEDENRRCLAQWQRAPLICGELVLLLDENCSAALAGTRIVYDKEDGLTYGKEETGEGEGV